ncbi:MAG: hypothetical protein B7Y36_00370 [Novosphingobium sp. 28-62-57]|uniref:hypothetical protein n=1 Tax=unclassified Novosphingobium TaxID=2644732 RepID=UPI000BC9DDDD|nr:MULTISPECIES: hypothetical protein [unclassified Novosphingobium]OYW48792.1 MAG: hypothetical protein B7Z34_12035 [Novosphingobium sp. 12-62-10]OYZ12051.1 MAG: hypothetical protein B7Y36_00370 [Novosphingobium sp. 28-62-57]OYZ97358.1 MAG: hypothetical protein B7X96_03195 [Novosphingobium sp. 17-62-8]HQS69444.1 hypothetical protein [Novosphingobium sp.]
MRKLLVLAALVLAGTATARDSLGVFGTWGAFRDPAVPRCYAIAMAEKVRGRQQAFQPYLTVGYWPQRKIRGAVHVRLARRVAAGSSVNVSFPEANFTLQTGQADAWPADQRVNAGIVVQLRSAPRVMVIGQGTDGRKFRDTYVLSGAASAMDAAALGCVR